MRYKVGFFLLSLAFAACSSIDRPPPKSDQTNLGSSGGITGDGGDASTTQSSVNDCSGDAGSIVILAGDPEHYILKTTEKFSSASATDSITIRAAPSLGIPTNVQVYVARDGGADYSVGFQNNPNGLVVGTYEDAGREPFDNPGLSAFSPGRGCNTVTGRFVIQEMTWDTDGGVSGYEDAGLKSFSATFVHHCEGSEPTLVGCVRWTK